MHRHFTRWRLGGAVRNGAASTVVAGKYSVLVLNIEYSRSLDMQPPLHAACTPRRERVEVWTAAQRLGVVWKIITAFPGQMENQMRNLLKNVFKKSHTSCIESWCSFKTLRQNNKWTNSRRVWRTIEVND
ncbi:Protein of unknown function [Gryllus bimaculatus]|nr:Protein of unknown function [Gryllus bimaculatus]